jgi:hypothetical protein
MKVPPECSIHGTRSVATRVLGDVGAFEVQP